MLLVHHFLPSPCNGLVLLHLAWRKARAPRGPTLLSHHWARRETKMRMSDSPCHMPKATSPCLPHKLPESFRHPDISQRLRLTPNIYLMNPQIPPHPPSCNCLLRCNYIVFKVLLENLCCEQHRVHYHTETNPEATALLSRVIPPDLPLFWNSPQVDTCWAKATGVVTDVLHSLLFIIIWRLFVYSDSKH